MSVFRLEVINFVPDLLRGGGSLHYDCTYDGRDCLLSLQCSGATTKPCQFSLFYVVALSLALSPFLSVSPKQLADERSDISTARGRC